VDIYFDTEEYHPTETTLKIYVQREPDIIHQCYNYLQNDASKYDLIFCYDPTRLSGVKNAHSSILAGTWIEPSFYQSIDISKKTFSISNLTGWKTGCVAYHLRHLLYQNQQAFQHFPITFYRSSAHIIIPEITNNPLIPKEPLSSKYILFEKHQFSIVIENTREKNYFSEKLMDCLITKTIPIYYGCQNIGDYFNTDGWILLNDEQNFLQELYTQLHTLNETYYMAHYPIIEENYETAVLLANEETNFENRIRPFL
jgi:hypothetical protein